MTELAERAGQLIWGPWTAAAVMAAGIWLSGKAGWVQILGIKKWWAATVGSFFSKKKDTGGISPFQSATAALAGSLGTGNIVGVAVAISAGGPGAIFWMWLAAVPSMATAYAENVLGIRYRRRDGAGRWAGGPMMYMRHGLGWKRVSYLWAGLCAAAALCVGNLVQVNSIAAAAGDAWGVPAAVVGVVLALAAAPAILGGARSVTKMTERLVPFMAAAYILACLAVIGINFHRLPAAFGRIVGEAFAPESVGGGVLGTMLVGVRRGVFTHEAGMGTSVLIHCTADTDRPEIQGYWSVFEVFLDTIVMCGLTALAILCSGADGRAQGAAMSAEAFRQIFGGFSGSFSAIVTLLFAFATVAGWSCCGERSFAYLTGERGSLWYRVLYVAMIIPGCIMNTGAVWAVCDILNAFLMLPNLAAVVMLWGKEAEKSPNRIHGRGLGCTKDYQPT